MSNAIDCRLLLLRISSALSANLLKKYEKEKAHIYTSVYRKICYQVADQLKPDKSSGLHGLHPKFFHDVRHDIGLAIALRI